MGDRLGQQDGYPAGVSNSDPHFHDEDAPCMCSHMPDEHVDGDGPCEVPDCDCAAYETDYGDV